VARAGVVTLHVRAAEEVRDQLITVELDPAAARALWLGDTDRAVDGAEARSERGREDGVVLKALCADDAADPRGACTGAVEEVRLQRR